MRRFPLVLLVLAMAVPAFGWDTRTVKESDDSESWLSAYQSGPPGDLLPQLGGFTRDEHSELAHLALDRLGIAREFGILSSTTGLANIDVVDLNAALFRRELSSESRFGDDTAPASVLEERLLPPPAHFAGLPDYTFTPYDWMNKSFVCPSLTERSSLRERCHIYYAGYLTVFNSSHFGSQATVAYGRYHTIALSLAARAQVLRTMLEQSTPADAAAHEIYVKERELEALVYEGFAQHFLQDRWSVGHMWERWSGPDEDRSVGLDVGTVIGGVAGLIHGSEALTGLPDPMSSPPVIGSPPAAVPVQWQSRADGGRYPGLGDERLLDMFDGGFGLEYGLPDMPISVVTQQNRMLDCSQAGWMEVVQAFGRNQSGGYGAWNVSLPAISFPPLLTNDDCWQNWATNAAIHAGWVDDQLATSAADLSRALVSLRPLVLVPIPAVLDVIRADLAALTVRIRARTKANALGTNLARGQINEFLGVGSGDVYSKDAGGRPAPAAYAEPENLDDLPDEDPATGRDKRTVYGFFNRAHVDYWCEGLAARLAPLRGSADPTDVAACAYLADRVYKRTDPAYRGVRGELRMHGSEEVDPICSYFGVETSNLDENLPYFLHPGYVATPGTPAAYSYASVEAWCRKVPVIDAAPCDQRIPPDGSDGWDVVARVGAAGGIVTLKGRNFGDSIGQIVARATESASDGIELDIVAWSDTEIQFQVTSEQVATVGQWFLTVVPVNRPDRSSVGRFILRVGEGCLPGELLGSWTLRRTDVAGERYGFYLLDDGTVMRHFGTRQVWVKIGDWTTSGNTLKIERCPTPNFESFRFDGTWSADAEADQFGVRSCPVAVTDPCPAIKGTYTHVFTDGTPAANSYPVDSAGGYVSAARWTEIYGEGWMTCHGTCGEYWSTKIGNPSCMKQ